MKKHIWVIAEKRKGTLHSSTYELLGKARELAFKMPDTLVTCVTLMNRSLTPEERKRLSEQGSDVILNLVHKKFKRFDYLSYLETLNNIAERFSPEIILAPATTTGRTIMPALAASLRTGLTADCTGLDIDKDGRLLQTRPAIGGNIMATIKTPKHKPQMATVRPKTFTPLAEKYSETGIYHEIIPLINTSSKTKLVEFQEISAEQKSIQDAEIVISGGKGIRKPENLELLKKLAGLLNGTVGASRPLVDSKWIGHENQVGLSGHTVKPKVYIAAGISGAVQHVAGMQTSEVIIAINKDINAPIFDYSDIGLVGDAVEILETLYNALTSLKEEISDVGNSQRTV
ncbi:MAG TPA: electron transfer flavoprotein subunit alpha/FixB family protein [Thermotogaceae bacterium]|uniref:electron transfer flavoprotein subunit alpha/FixB family protein n=1 Tax=Kosmotoga sp. TaxID=1955248 RepID=UPI0017EE93D4|nr:electron transfer flavoprotein subunit alpha/FixB family protein [Kosmotoga sp.]MCD6159785.1 electron transfer flavoprotein subunit alpha/FixB family protein [Kosmotoga sp.]HEW91381.1 electron transfer flavoprotein subunit alpha/FixB family protein [Thermotogaceae bacterium]